MANRKAKLSAIVLFALLSAAPVQADWFSELFPWVVVPVDSGGTEIVPQGPGGGDPPGPIEPE